MTLPDVITYVWLGQAFLGIIDWGADPDVRQQVRTGTVAYEMLRPVDIPFYWFARVMAQRVGTLVLRATPILILSFVVIGISLPPSAASFFAFVASMVGALLLSSAPATVLTVSLLWTVSGEGISRMMPAVAYALSGMAVPLPLYPDWMIGVLNFLPFRGLINIPFRLYLCHIPATDLLMHLGHQLEWTVVLLLFSRALFHRSRRNLVVQGG